LEKNFEALMKELTPPHRYIVCIEEAAKISGDMDVIIEHSTQYTLTLLPSPSHLLTTI